MGTVGVEPAQVGHVRHHATRLCRSADDPTRRERSLGPRQENRSWLHSSLCPRVQVHHVPT